MLNFNLGSLANWKPLGIGEILDLEVPTAGYRSVSFDIMAGDTVTVHAVSGEDYWIVGHGSGEMAIKFSIDKPVGVVVVGDASTDVFIRTLTDNAVIPESVEASYTSIEPRPAGPSDDVRRMMHMVKINQARREAQLVADMEARFKALASVAPAPAPAAPTPAPAPVDPPAGEGGAS